LERWMGSDGGMMSCREVTHLASTLEIKTLGSRTPKPSCKQSGCIAL
jgi:hypothetical protein